MSHDLSLFLKGGGLQKTTLSFFKDVTLRLGGEGSKARVTMSLFLPFFFLTASLTSFDFQSTVFSQPIKMQTILLEEILIDAFSKFVPCKTVLIRPNDQPWILDCYSVKRIETTLYIKELTPNTVFF